MGGLRSFSHSIHVSGGRRRQVKAALSAMIVKTDRKDARGIAQLLRMGWHRPVHRKSLPAQEIRVLLVGRKLLQAKLLDVELGIRGLLRGSPEGYRGDGLIRPIINRRPELMPRFRPGLVADAAGFGLTLPAWTLLSMPARVLGHHSSPSS